MEIEALKYVLGLLQLVVTAWCVHMYSQLGKAQVMNEKLATDLSQHKLHTSETYVTKSESTRAFDALSKTLDSLIATINSRFDRMDTKLDSKMDKGN